MALLLFGATPTATTSNGLLWPLARARVGLCSLPTDWQSAAMAQAAVAADLHQPLDVHADLSPQVTFHPIVAGDDLAQTSDLVLSQILHACVGIDPGLDKPKEFLARLAGLVKWALRSDLCQVRISSLAGATAQREATVRAGLAWLAARGHVAILDETDETVRLAPGDQTVAADLSDRSARLQVLIEETAAYRAFFARADGRTLIAGDTRPAADGA